MTSDTMRAPTRLHGSVDEHEQRVAAEVRAEIARQRITEDQLAVVFAQHQTWVSRRKTGKVPWSAGQLVVLADYMGVPVEQFFRAGPGSGPATSSGCSSRRLSSVTPLRGNALVNGSPAQYDVAA